MHQQVTKRTQKGTPRTQKGTPRKQLHENTTENTSLGALSAALEAFGGKTGQGFGCAPGPPGATQRVFCTALGVLTSFVPSKWLKPEKPRDAEALLGTCSGKPEPRSAAEAAECAKGLLGHSWDALANSFSRHFGIVLGPLVVRF